MIEGRATPEGTASLASNPASMRKALGLTLSTVGMGSYLGRTEEAARHAYVEAALACLQGGINVLDSAANYRDQASERDLGAAIAQHVASGGRRDAFLVSSKAGFLHGDCDEADADAWFEAEYTQSGVLAKGDVLSGHSLAPAYLLHELARSRANLGLSTLDVLFLHNPEHQLEWGVPEAEFYHRIERAFEALERAVDAGHIAMYGVATWDGLRVPPGSKGHLSLIKLVHHAGAARMKVGGRASEHHFRALQLPVNLAMTEAALVPTQPYRFGAQTVLDCAKDLGFLVMASASLVQMRMAGRIPPEYREAFGTSDDAQTALQFTRSVPGVTTALVGMGLPQHARANAAFAQAIAPQPAVVRTLLGTGSLHGA